MKQRRRYFIKVYQGKRKSYKTKSLRRFLRHIRTIKWEKGQIKAYLRVSYGKLPDYRGKLTTFYNDGTYTDKQNFDSALKAFLKI